MASASRTMRTPVASSESSFFASLSSALRVRSSATPPPATTPSAIAARVALSASSTRAFFSFISVSVAAPISSTATPPSRRPTRFSSFSRSHLDLASLACERRMRARSSTAAFSPPPPMTVVLFLPMMTLFALPNMSAVISLSSMPWSLPITRPPVRMARSSSCSFWSSPKPGALTAHALSTREATLSTQPNSSSALTR